MAFLRANFDFDVPVMRGVTHASRLSNASTLQLFSDSEPLSRPEWHALAACRTEDTAVFFAGRGHHEKWRAAKAICDGCEVQETCLEYAMATGQKFGVWGGMSERERRKERRLRAIARAS